MGQMGWATAIVVVAVIAAAFLGLRPHSALPVIVVGGGLAGLSATHTILHEGGQVILVDKQPRLGGNSMKASSGINSAVSHVQQAQQVTDSLEDFEMDTMMSAQGEADPLNPLVSLLVMNSASALQWLADKFDIDLSMLSQLGGHSHRRTHRPAKTPVGATIMSALIDRLEDHSSDVELRLNTEMLQLINEGGAVAGVQVRTSSGEVVSLRGPVILATGGYANDHSETSLLRKYVPHLADVPTTNGPWAQGEGIKAATKIGAALVDMDQVQVHPTGFVDPANPQDKTKFLCGEALRGEGGLILNSKGQRFTNELGLREAVTAAMNQQEGKKFIVLNSKAAAHLGVHIKFYTFKALLTKYSDGWQMAAALGFDSAELEEQFRLYNAAAETKSDAYGKPIFPNAPFEMHEEYFAGEIVPVLHYTMGGVRFNEKAQLLRETPNGGLEPISGLYGAGEVTGGLHGKNRLGGNSLLECVVYGRIAGRHALAYSQVHRL